MTIKTVSLFSGAGGMDLGFQTSGYEILWANDIDRDAASTYEANLGDHIVLQDLKKIQYDRIPKGEVVIGGPPCQSFSLVGKRDLNNENGKMVWEYLNAIKYVKPKAFIFENVVGLNSARTPSGGKVWDDLKAAFVNLGYFVKKVQINAADFGIPQRRKRVFIFGFDTPVDFVLPKKTHDEIGSEGMEKWIPVWDAISDLPSPVLSGDAEYSYPPTTKLQEILRGSGSVVTEHIIPKVSELDKRIIESIPVGGNYMDVPDDIPSARIKKFKETGGRTTCYCRLEPDKPAYTINTYFNRPNVGCNIHYGESRLITIREAMRIQTFPDDFKLKSKTERGKYKAIGNAVPPMLAKVLAEHLKKYV